MDDTDIPNRKSNMVKAEGDRDEPGDQRTSDASTISNGGLAGGRPEGGAKKKSELEQIEDNPTLRTEM